MNTNLKTIRKMNVKGQVTLPSKWRDRIGTDLVVLEDDGNQLIVRPADIIVGEEVLFDAIRDNKGKGIPIEDLIKELEKDLK